MKRTLIVLGITVSVLALFSCASTPETPEEQTQPTVGQEQAPETIPLPEAQRAEAGELRQIISEYELSQFAEEDYQVAEQAFEEARASYGSDNKTSLAKYNEAIEYYNRVIDKGVDSLREKKTAQANQAKEKADSVKAQNAVPQEYQQAMSTYNQAQQSLDNKDYRQALKQYNDAISQFQSVYETALKKRQEAEKAMQQADQSIEQTQKAIQGFEEDRQTFTPDQSTGQ